VDVSGQRRKQQVVPGAVPSHAGGGSLPAGKVTDHKPKGMRSGTDGTLFHLFIPAF